MVIMTSDRNKAETDEALHTLLLRDLFASLPTYGLVIMVDALTWSSLSELHLNELAELHSPDEIKT